ncbi:MAG: 1-phosphofructokinase [Candidatus Accumulibacter sp.]|jgi:1-phosphofructokinase|nr:1-phosphofructokinase [Accumulibacter sp.]
MNPIQHPAAKATVLCVALNPAIDLTIEVANLRPGEVNRAQRAQQDAGGKGINVASCLADYGADVAVTGQLGRDNPALFAALFAAKGIADRCLYIDGSTRVNAKVVDPAKGQTTDLNLPGYAQTRGQIDAQIARLERLIDELAPPPRWVVLSGSLPPGWPDAIYATLIRRVRASGGQVVLDTSGQPLAAALDAAPEIVKPNRDELAEHLGRPLGSAADAANAARALLAAHPGIRLIAVSMGQEGAVFVTPDAALLAHPLDVEPISSVGAGDAMVAGITAAQLASLPVDACARLATAFAAAKLARLGPHLPAPDTVRSLAEKVRLTPVRLPCPGEF